MEEALKLLNTLFSPTNSWGNFVRKSLTTVLVASIGAYAYNRYEYATRSSWEDLPLHTAIEEGNRKEKAQEYVNDMMREYQTSINSIWVYSWPDARNLLPVIQSGHHANPLPLNYFQMQDATAIGQLALEQCAEVDRPNRSLIACPIIAANDAWGVTIFEIKEGVDRPDYWRSTFGALTHKLSNFIYK